MADGVIVHDKSRFWFACLGAAALAIVWWWGFYYQPTHEAQAKPFEGDSSELQHTIIVPTLDTPIPEGKSAIWCGSFQLASAPKTRNAP